MEIDPLSLETLVYGDNAGDYRVLGWDDHPFPFKRAEQLRRLSWHGSDMEPLSKALPNCPNVTALNFTLYGWEDEWTIERLQEWPSYTTLRQLEIDLVKISDEIGWSCLLLPFARFSRQVPNPSAVLITVACAADRRDFCLTSP